MNRPYLLAGFRIPNVSAAALSISAESSAAGWSGLIVIPLGGDGVVLAEFGFIAFGKVGHKLVVKIVEL